MAAAAAMAALRATVLANVVAAGGGDKDGCRNGRGWAAMAAGRAMALMMTAATAGAMVMAMAAVLSL